MQYKALGLSSSMAGGSNLQGSSGIQSGGGLIKLTEEQFYNFDKNEWKILCVWLQSS